MNLVIRYMNIQFVMLHNKGKEDKHIFGNILKPGYCMYVESGMAHTMLGMIQDGSLEILYGRWHT